MKTLFYLLVFLIALNLVKTEDKVSFTKNETLIFYNALDKATKENES